MLSGSTGKTAKIVIYDKRRVNGGNNYFSPGQRWVHKLVHIYRYLFTVISTVQFGGIIFQVKGIGGNNES